MSKTTAASVTVKKWGNSLAVRIPAHVAAASRLRVDSRVNVREQNGRVIIEPAAPAEYDLAALVAGITPENLHAEVGIGRPVGKEAL